MVYGNPEQFKPVQMSTGGFNRRFHDTWVVRNQQQTAL